MYKGRVRLEALHQSITAFEEISANAWPALSTYFYGGWLLRRARGYTKRANSVLPLYAAPEPLPGRISFCEDFYARAGLPVLFKLTEASQPAGLDGELGRCGYERGDETSFQVLDLSGFNPGGAVDERFMAVDKGAWHRIFASMSGLSSENAGTFCEMLDHATGEVCYGLFETEGGTAACGMAVLSRGSAGIFDVHVREDLRGRGLGERLMRSLLALAARQGAHTAYLQVVKGNLPAEKLYGKLGFKEKYWYWYRSKPS